MSLRIYVGANNKALGLSQGQQFTSDGAQSDVWPDYAPQHIKEALAKSPGVARLFVDFDQYLKSRQATLREAVARPDRLTLPQPPIKAYTGVIRSHPR